MNYEQRNRNRKRRQASSAHRPTSLPLVNRRPPHERLPRRKSVSLDEATRRLRRVQQALSTDVIELRKRREKDYKRLRAELYSEKARDDPDAYFIEYLETQLQDARRALSAPPEGSLDVSPTPSIGLEDTLGVIKNLEILSTRLSSPVPRT